VSLETGDCARPTGDLTERNGPVPSAVSLATEQLHRKLSFITGHALLRFAALLLVVGPELAVTQT